MTIDCHDESFLTWNRTNEFALDSELDHSFIDVILLGPVLPLGAFQFHTTPRARLNRSGAFLSINFSDSRWFGLSREGAVHGLSVSLGESMYGVLSDAFTSRGSGHHGSERLISFDFIKSIGAFWFG
jgi:hypothetical protein